MGEGLNPKPEGEELVENPEEAEEMPIQKRLNKLITIGLKK